MGGTQSSNSFDSPLMKRLKGPICVSHRGGASSFAPENTMYGYKRSVYEENVQVLEIDVRKTKDGKLVLLHNPTVDATTNGTGYLSNMTFEEVRSLDAAYNWSPDGNTYPLRGKGVQIPELNEVLDEFVEKKPDLVFFFDLKQKEVVEDVLQIIQSRKLEHRVILGAVFRDTNAVIMKLKPKSIPLAIDIRSMLSYCTKYNLGLSSTVQHEIVGLYVNERIFKMLSKKFFDVLREKGCWTAVFGPLLDVPEAQATFIEWGVDLIVTDRPDVLNHTLKNHQIQTQITTKLQQTNEQSNVILTEEIEQHA